MNIDKILEIAIKNNASDVHLVHGLFPILRIDGKLFSLRGSSLEESEFSDTDKDVFSISELNTREDDKFFIEEPACSDKTEVSVMEAAKDQGNLKLVTSDDIHKMLKKSLRKEQLERFYKERDYDFSYQFDGFRFRVNLSYERSNFKAVFRIINKQSPTLEDVDLPERVKELLNLNHGLILVTGPSGCGKSTSLAAMINYINTTRNCNIVTLEDPNIVMVGEMRDLETISTAITLAETGHLILATLHTCNSAQTVDRIIDTFPAHQQNQVKSQLSLTLSAIISQVLLPKIGGGRVAAREILINNSAISNLIRDQKIAQIKSIIDTHSREGMISFEKSIKNLCDQGVVDISEAKQFLDDKLFFN